MVLDNPQYQLQKLITFSLRIKNIYIKDGGLYELYFFHLEKN